MKHQLHDSIVYHVARVVKAHKKIILSFRYDVSRLLKVRFDVCENGETLNAAQNPSYN